MPTQRNFPREVLHFIYIFFSSLKKASSNFSTFWLLLNNQSLSSLFHSEDPQLPWVSNPNPLTKWFKSPNQFFTLNFEHRSSQKLSAVTMLLFQGWAMLKFFCDPDNIAKHTEMNTHLLRKHNIQPWDPAAHAALLCRSFLSCSQASSISVSVLILKGPSLSSQDVWAAPLASL